MITILFTLVFSDENLILFFFSISFSNPKVIKYTTAISTSDTSTNTMFFCNESNNFDKLVIFKRSFFFHPDYTVGLRFSLNRPFWLADLLSCCIQIHHRRSRIDITVSLCPEGWSIKLTLLFNCFIS